MVFSYALLSAGKLIKINYFFNYKPAYFICTNKSKMNEVLQGGDCCAQEERPVMGQQLTEPQPGRPDRPIGNPKIKVITIEQLDLGYVVRVGCQGFAIETSSKLISALGEYLNAPSETEKKWFDGKFLK